jgi:hypothetical protein
MARYYLFLRENPKVFAKLSPSDFQRIVERYSAWRKKNSRHVKGGQKLRDGEGRLLRGQGQALRVADGPFAEAKEVLGGFFVVEAPSYTGAIRIARSCPHLEFGSLEIRAEERT